MSYELISSDQTDAQYLAKLQADALARANGVYARTIFVALGGTGAKALLHLRRMVLERFGQVHALPGVAYLSIDTDTGSASPAPTAAQQKEDPFSQLVAFHPERERVNLNANISNLLGPNLALNQHIRDWWDESLHITQQGFNVEAGAGQIRPLARLLFFENHRAIADRLREAYNAVTRIDVSNQRVNMTDRPRVIIISGWAGGTGSGTFLDMAALVRKTIPESTVSVEGIFALPSVVRTKETTGYPKAAANGYAALREINHYLSHPFEAQWARGGRREVVRGLYDRCLLLSSTNYSGTDLGDDDAVYRAIAEALFLDFSAGQMAGWIQGVRINRAQYLGSYVTYQYQITRPDNTAEPAHADKWLTKFGTFGIAKLTYPAWRLLNYAKYDLAAEMAGLMDREQTGSMDDLITMHRDRFMHGAGFFQGDMTTEEGGRQRHWQVRDALARASGVAGDVGSVFEHIAKLAGELKVMAESCYADKTTIPDCQARWREAQRLLGDAGSAGAEGDWILQLRKNRLSFVQSVRENLPKVIEEFREKPSVGPSGVRYVLEGVLDTLGRPADQVLYGEFFRSEVPRLETAAKEALAVWERQTRNADEASRGLFKAADTHREAMGRAAEAFDTYWSCRFKVHLADEAVRALEAIKAIIREQLGLLERICEAIVGLRGHFLNCRDYYATPRPSPIAREIPVARLEINRLLEPFLGTDPEERRTRLSRLLQRGLREMNLLTLEALSTKLANDRDTFKENLAAQAFYALRGNNGFTVAFTGDDGKPIEGFIERNAILRHLPTGNTVEMERMVRDLYQAAMPLLALHTDGDAASKMDPKTDAFLGLVQTGGGGDEASHKSAAASQILQATLANVQRTDFRPMTVTARDPTEIILYTELNAIPAFALRDIYHQGGVRDHYDTILYDDARSTPLHIHRDYVDFQEIVPLSVDDVAKLRRAWKAYLQAMFLGVIRSMPARADDQTRFVYQMHTQRTAFESKWTDLGPEPLVLRRIMADRSFESLLQRQLDQEIKRFRALPGRWSHLCALAEYTYHAVFPVIRMSAQAGTGRNAALGSMASMVLADIRDDWRGEAARMGHGKLPAEFEASIIQHITDLAGWTLPIARDIGKPVPLTPQPQPQEVVNTWGLYDLAHEAVMALVSRGQLPSGLDEDGRHVFPRLAINWAFFETLPRDSADPVPDERLTTSRPERFSYRGPKGDRAYLDPDTIAGLVNEAPHARHEVRQEGWATWKDAWEVAVIKPLLVQEAIPRGHRDTPTVQTTTARPAPSDASTPPAPVTLAPTLTLPGHLGAPGPATGETFHYTRDGVKLGQLPAAAIAAEVERYPAARHRVWNKRLGEWRDAATVDEIAAHLESPPPDDMEPPPDFG